RIVGSRGVPSSREGDPACSPPDRSARASPRRSRASISPDPSPRLTRRTSTPRWTSTRCWCSTAAPSPRSSSSRSRCASARASTPSAAACGKPDAPPPPSGAGPTTAAKARVFPRDSRTRLFALGNRLWHSDSSFKPVPAKYSILHSHSVPSKGGNTEFADMRTAYDALDADTKREIDDLICEHSQIFSRQQLGFTDFTDEERARFAPVRQRLVRTHPSTGRKSLFLASQAGGIVGWPVPESRAFLRDLVEHATQRQFVYSHRWQVGDLVMWDNRRTMHRVRPYPDGERRDMRRTTLMGDGPTAAHSRMQSNEAIAACSCSSVGGVGRHAC